MSIEHFPITPVDLGTLRPGQRPDYIEQIRSEIRGEPYRAAKRKKPAKPLPDEDTCRRMFTVCDGNRWMDLGEREPDAKMLFGEFWHQNELSILFADTNTGKSVLAVQMAENIAKGKNTGPFACGAGPQNVLYVDFELTTTQFYQRYGSREGSHRFPEGFFRAQFNTDVNTEECECSYDDMLIAALEQKILLVKAKVLIIDNITCLRGGTENASIALRLMKNLKGLKADHKLSILVLAHTPKRRAAARPISADDLYGSKLLISFADSAFAIGASTTEKGLCYLKQVKQRNTQQLYGEDNVCLCRIIKPNNLLQFKFEGSGTERHQLLSHAAKERQQLAKQVAELTKQGLTQRQISEELHISTGLTHKLQYTRVHVDNPTDTATVPEIACPPDVGDMDEAPVPVTQPEVDLTPYAFRRPRLPFGMSRNPRFRRPGPAADRVALDEEKYIAAQRACAKDPPDHLLPPSLE